MTKDDPIRIYRLIPNMAYTLVALANGLSNGGLEATSRQFVSLRALEDRGLVEYGRTDRCRDRALVDQRAGAVGQLRT